MNITYPTGWPKWDFTAKAGWLKARGYARTFEEACGMLAKMPRRKRKPAPVYSATERTQNHWWNKED